MFLIKKNQKKLKIRTYKKKLETLVNVSNEKNQKKTKNTNLQKKIRNIS